MLETIEEIHLDNGSRVFIKKHRRFGLYSASFDKGAVPAVLSGNFTNLRELKDKVRYYVENRAAKNRTTIRDEVQVELGDRQTKTGDKQPRNRADTTKSPVG